MISGLSFKCITSTRYVVLAAAIAASIMLSGCMNLMYGGPGYTQSVPVTVSLNDNTYEILKHYDRSVEVVLDNNKVVELSHTFVLGSDICGDVGCIPAARIKSIIITDERFDAENAIFETAARIQAVTIWAAFSPFLSNGSAGSLRERMSVNPSAFLETTAQDASRHETAYAHPICGSAKYTPEVADAPEFHGTLDEQAAQWLWENRFRVPGICILRSRLLYSYYLSPEQQIELSHLQVIHEYWERARCQRALFHSEAAQGFSEVTRSHPAYTIIEARLKGMNAEEAWERFKSILLRDEWVDGSDADLERVCKDAGGVAEPTAWAARLAELRNMSLSFDAGSVAFVGTQREMLNDECKGLEREDRGNCYLQIFVPKNERGDSTPGQE